MHLQLIDDAFQAPVEAAYSRVRDYAGRPALLDHRAFIDRANAVKQKQLAPRLPAEIHTQLDDIASGRLPLTVSTAQHLDNAWSAVQRRAQDDAERMAIWQVRAALHDAPVTDALGQESMQAYREARELARKRVSLIELLQTHLQARVLR
jgi:hypothetical protein